MVKPHDFSPQSHEEHEAAQGNRFLREPVCALCGPVVQSSLLNYKPVVGIAGIHFQRLIQGTDGNLQLGVVRLAGGQTLQRQAGGDDQLDQRVGIILGAPPEKLIGDAGYQRQQYDARTGLEDERPELGDHRKDRDADQHDDQQKAGAAARMQTAVTAHVFDRQFHSGLEGKDRFMFGSVVLEHPADVFHTRDAPDVEQEDDHADYAVHQVENDIVVADDRDHQLGQVEREQKKQGDAEAEGHSHSAGHGPGGQLSARFFSLFILLFFRHSLVGREIERLDADDQRTEESHRTTQDRQFHDRITLGKRHNQFSAHHDLAVGATYGDGHGARRPHHDSFDNSLPAYIDFFHYCP